MIGVYISLQSFEVTGKSSFVFIVFKWKYIENKRKNCIEFYFIKLNSMNFLLLDISL